MNKITISELTKQVIGPLASVAREKGDYWAARELIKVAHLLCAMVDNFRISHPSVAREIARHRDIWPALVAPHIGAMRDLETALNDIHLAHAHPRSPLLTGRIDLGRTLSSVAIQILDDLVAYRRRPHEINPVITLASEILPTELTSDSFEPWWELGLELFLHYNHQDLFNDLRLARIKERHERIANRQGDSVAGYTAGRLKQTARLLWLMQPEPLM